MSKNKPDDAGVHDDRDGATDQGTIQRRQEERGDRRFTLVVVDGPEAGRRLEIAPDQGRVFVGKSNAVQLQLTDPEVSRRHAAFEPTSSSLRITDCDSKNGTLVNGVSMLEALLVGGELLTIGATTLRVESSPGIGAELSPVPQFAVRFGRLVGASPQMRSLYPLLRRLASAMVPVLLEGETGTGKELTAEVIHEASPRALHPFVVIDLAAVAASEVEVYLFGTEGGPGDVPAGTSGCFEMAENGTVFIDDVSELGDELQGKLVRVLERGEFRRVGSTRWRKANVRLICATRRDLEKEIHVGRFRDDLYYRLAVARVELPPLRRRENDIVFLAKYFWGRLGGPPSALTPEFLLRLEAHAWPGNVRELLNWLSRRLALGEMADAAARVSEPNLEPARNSCEDSIQKLIDEGVHFTRGKERLCLEFERRFINHILEKCGGNVSRAAAASGIARRHFYAIKARQVR